MVPKFFKNAGNKTFNKRNIIPMIGATIGTIGAALAITAILSPTLFGLLSISLLALGFTPALLGVITVLSLVIFAGSIQQMFTNRAIEENKLELAVYVNTELANKADKTEVEKAKTDLEDQLGKKLDKAELEGEVKGMLPTLLQDTGVVQQFKTALGTNN